MLKLKFIIIVCSTIVLLTYPSISNAGNIQFVTYYPAPQGAFDRLTLLPQSVLPTPCPIGSLRTEQSSGKLFYCHNISGVGTWGLFSNVWTQSGTYIYPTTTDTNSLIFASIGISIPQFKLTLENDGGILAIGTLGSGVVTAYPSLTPNQTAPAQARFIWYPRKAAFRAIWDRWGVTDDTQLGAYSTGFGDTPTVTGIAATASGLFNTASGDYSVVAGGSNNTASGNYSTNTGGLGSTASGQYSVISGINNLVFDDYATVSGGIHNYSRGTGAIIVGGWGNQMSFASTYATLAGGGNHRIPFSSNYGTIAGGVVNHLDSADYSTINGGYGNYIKGFYGYIGGGKYNNIHGNYNMIGGGEYANNDFDESGNAVLIPDHSWAVITGGRRNYTKNNYATVLGGETNNTSGISSVITGGSNNIINGNYSVITGGDRNTADGDYSWVGGRYINLTNTANRTFVWGYSDKAVNITAANSFILSPGTDSGGSSIYNPKLGINEPNPSGILSITLPSGSNSNFLAITSTNIATPGNILTIKNDWANSKICVGINNPNPNCTLYALQIGNIGGPKGVLTIGGVWTTPSSRDFKENIQPLNVRQAIEVVEQLQPVTYNYKVDPREHHVGFIAEDVPELIAAQDRNSVNPMNITAVLTAVLKEQKKVITQQEKILTTLGNNIRDLKTEFTNP